MWSILLTIRLDRILLGFDVEMKHLSILSLNNLDAENGD